MDQARFGWGNLRLVQISNCNSKLDCLRVFLVRFFANGWNIRLHRAYVASKCFQTEITLEWIGHFDPIWILEACVWCLCASISSPSNPYTHSAGGKICYLGRMTCNSTKLDLYFGKVYEINVWSMHICLRWPYTRLKKKKFGKRWINTFIIIQFL